MTKAFLIAGIIGALLFMTLFFGYMGFSFKGYEQTEITSVGQAFLSGGSFIGGALTFQLPSCSTGSSKCVPIWANWVVWLFTIALIVMIVETILGG